MYANWHVWDLNNSNATIYHEIKVGILGNTCFKENVLTCTFENLVGWILRLGLNFWVKCLPLWLEMWSCLPWSILIKVSFLIWEKALIQNSKLTSPAMPLLLMCCGICDRITQNVSEIAQIQLLVFYMKSLFPKPLTSTATCYSFVLLTSFCN